MPEQSSLGLELVVLGSPKDLVVSQSGIFRGARATVVLRRNIVPPTRPKLLNQSSHQPRALNISFVRRDSIDQAKVLEAAQAQLRLAANMATTSNMFLYSLTVQPPTNVVQAVLGQFAGTREQLIITGAGSQLTLLRPDPSQGKVITLLSHDIFGIIRSLAAFRLAGSNKGKSSENSMEDHLVIFEGDATDAPNAAPSRAQCHTKMRTRLTRPA